MRWVFAIAVLLASVTLSSCTRPAVPVAVPSPRSAAPVKVELSPGSAVTLRNGLSLTVPAGWEGTMTTQLAQDDALRPTEYVLLENRKATSGPKVVMMFSSAASEIPTAVINERGLDDFVRAGRVGDIDLLVGQRSTAYRPRHLMAAVTRLPDSELGLVFFAGDAADPKAAWGVVYDLLAIGRTQGE